MSNHQKKINVLLEMAKKHKDAIWSTQRSKVGHNLRSMAYKNNTVKLDISNFDELIEINKEELFIYVEPNIRMDKLVEKLLPMGFRPQVVPEFKGITVGGAIQGLAGESSSFEYGFFHDACLEYEILLGSGEIVIANKEKNADLFYAIPGSYGSLGIITLVKLKIVRCHP